MPSDPSRRVGSSQRSSRVAFHVLTSVCPPSRCTHDLSLRVAWPWPARPNGHLACVHLPPLLLSALEPPRATRTPPPDGDVRRAPPRRAASVAPRQSQCATSYRCRAPMDLHTLVLVNNLKNSPELNNRTAWVCAYRGDGRIGIQMVKGAKRVWIEKTKLTTIPDDANLSSSPYNEIPSDDKDILLYVRTGRRWLRDITRDRREGTAAPSPSTCSQGHFVRGQRRELPRLRQSPRTFPPIAELLRPHRQPPAWDYAPLCRRPPATEASRKASPTRAASVALTVPKVTGAADSTPV